MSSQTNDEPSWKTSRRAVCMVMQGDLSGAQLLLATKPDDLHIANCSCFISTVKYLLLETPNYSPSQDAAFSCCRQLEERCAVDIGSWLTTVKHKLFRFSLNPDVDDLDRQIVRADALVYLGSLTAATVEPMSVGAAAKAVYGMSRAWKMYQQSYAAVLKVYSAIFDVDRGVPKWPPVLKRRQSTTIAGNRFGNGIPRSSTTSFELFRRNDMTARMTPEQAVRLMTAASTGFGVINLFLSLVPSRISSMTLSMLGFRGNRQTGLDALAFAKNGPGMHAPVAWLILSWYHMNVMNAGIEFDDPLARECRGFSLDEIEYLTYNPPRELKGTWLQKFFAGRCAYFKGDLVGSIRSFGAASRVNTYRNWNARCLQEMGFTYTMLANWDAALECFCVAAESSCSMRSYHYFLAAVCAGASGETTKVKQMLRSVLKSMKRENKIEFYSTFVAQKSSDIIKELKANSKIDPAYYKLIAYEVLYVVYGVSLLPSKTIRNIILDCQDDDTDKVTQRFTKKLLIAVCRRQTMECDNCRGSMLYELIGNMKKHKYGDHVYAYALYEMAIELISRPESIEEGKIIVEKLQNFKGQCYFKTFFETRCEALEAYVKKLTDH
ncbi:tetratricopeptide repeat protein 39C-like isoform X2 [Adelges cooleyi]|nr:tetratricopeptide repeat protein 39C-like isoform X2 [Adelges cooleyi]XP_050419575.1 tetratricopeptide repeat protein 39C-like isoform X2 [Adelges cooleyi]